MTFQVQQDPKEPKTPPEVEPTKPNPFFPEEPIKPGVEPDNPYPSIPEEPEPSEPPTQPQTEPKGFIN